MTKQSKMTVDLSGLKDLAKQAGDHVVKVGVLGDEPREDEQTNAEIGLVHEYGSVENNIPSRSFLRMPLQEKKRDLLKAGSNSISKRAIEKGEFKNALEQIGIAGIAAVQEAFETGGFGQWPDISVSTKDAKGSSSILIDTGQLRRSISSAVARRGDLNG